MQKLTMLYDHWQQTVRDLPHERALYDGPTNQSWSFSQLDRAIEKLEPNPEMVFPKGNSPQFIMEVLRGWRDGATICPLEVGQAPPQLHELPSEIRHVKITSGTTGAPRAILFTEKQLAADAENIVSTMELRPGAPNLAFISLAHSYGFSNLVTPLLLHGIPLILGGHPLPEVVKNSSRLAGRIVLPAVPALWRSWSEAGVIPANIQLAVSAGAPLSLALESEVLSRYGVKLHNFYGSSECGGIAFDRTNDLRTDSRMAGTSMNGVSGTLGSESCLCVESAAVGQTYWPVADPRLQNGHFQSNDLVEISSDGIRILGRAGDQLNLAGRKIVPEAIEEAVLLDPRILKCTVFGIPSVDAERGEIAVAAVVLKETVSPRDLSALLLNRLPAWQVPRRWWIVESLNESSRGKVSRRDLRQIYLSKGPDSSESH